jgi:hypothetical protein
MRERAGKRETREEAPRGLDHRGRMPKETGAMKKMQKTTNREEPDPQYFFCFFDNEWLGVQTIFTTQRRLFLLKRLNQLQKSEK